MNVELRLQDMERKLAALGFGNPAQALRTPFIHMDSSLSKSLMRGGLTPVLSDFNDVTTGEFQAQVKGQLGLTIVPDGDPLNGATVFGMANAVNLGVYAAALLSQGFVLPAPHIIIGIVGLTLDTIISLVNSATLYPVVIGNGVVATFTGNGVLQVSGDTQKLWGSKRTPASSAEAGNLGEICFDDDFLYICTSAGWKRTALTAF